MQTESRDWFGSTIGVRGRRKFDRALAEGASPSAKSLPGCPISRVLCEKWDWWRVPRIGTGLDTAGCPISRVLCEKWDWWRVLEDWRWSSYRWVPHFSRSLREVGLVASPED